MTVIDYTGLMGEEKKKTPEIDFSGLMEASPIKAETEPSQSYVERVLLAPEAVGELIAERGTLWEQYTADTSGLGYGKTFLQNIALPAQMLESGLSNPVIEMQKGNLNPIDWLVESAKGFGGVKRGEYGDVARQAGVPEPVSATLGLGASFAVPIAIINASKKLMAVTKFADTKLSKAASRFFNTVQKKGGALKKVGAKVGAYYDDIGNAAVDKSQYLDEMTNMTSSMKRSITDMPASKLAEVEDEILRLANQGDVNAVHQSKELIDDLISNYFTSTSKTQTTLRNTSKNLGQIIDDAAYNAKVRTIGDKGAKKYVENFQRRRKEYSELKNGFNYIKSKMVNPKTGEPTKTGALMRELADPRELNARQTLRKINVIGGKQVGPVKVGGVRTGANRLARELMAIESAIKRREFVSGAIRYAGHGILIGTVAGQAAGRIRSAEEEFLFGGGER